MTGTGSDPTAGFTWVRGAPRVFLRIEGAALFLAATLAYFRWAETPWWLYLVLFLAPDLAFLAMVAGRRACAIAYNVTHTTIGPILLFGYGMVGGAGWATAVSLIWAAHIGVDRAIGYGLRYPDGLDHSHLGPTGPAKRALEA